MRAPVSALAGLLILLLPTTWAIARPGDLDTTFGTGGKVLVHFTPLTGERGKGVAVQRDGKILLAGESNYGDALARFTTNGVLDVTFGSGGKFYQYTHGFPSAMALVADDKFIVAGGSLLSGITKDYFYMRRYTRNGAGDSTFGTAGQAAFDLGEHAFALDVGVQPDGKIVLVGPAQTGTQQDFGIVRCNANGTADTTFGQGGRLLADLGKSYDRCGGVAFQADGKMIVAGYSENSFDDARFAAVRYTTNGIADPTFNGNGVVTTSFGPGSEAFSVAVQRDGKILLGGWVNLQCALVRYTANGTLDPTFGPSGTGLVTKRVGSWDAWIKIGVQPDGKILAIGHTATFGRVIVARYNSNGTPDPGFGTDGAVVLAIGSRMSEASAFALQPDGKLLIAGTAWNTNNSYSDLALVRLENDAVAPPDISCPGPAVLDCRTPAEVTATLHNSSGLPLAVEWNLNGQILQTNSLAATNAGTDLVVYLTAEFPRGTNLLTVTVTDTHTNSDSCSTSLVVVDRNPPSIVSAAVVPEKLWPPNHQMVPIHISASATDTCDTADWKIVEVLSNEENPPGPGNGDPDWLITGDHALLLRAERSGQGVGRDYSIIIEATDTSGNLSEPKTLTVTVPK